MEPATVTVTISPFMIMLFGFLNGAALGWFLGGWYKSKRVQGLSKEDIKNLTEEKAKAYFGVVINEIKKLKQ